MHETGNEQGLNLEDENHMNHPERLANEATAIGQHFSQQVLLKGGEKFVPEDAKESPFQTAGIYVYLFIDSETTGNDSMIAASVLDGSCLPVPLRHY